jgi:hypothetical protein
MADKVLILHLQPMLAVVPAVVEEPLDMPVMAEPVVRLVLTQ